MNDNVKVIHEFLYVVGYRDFSKHYTLKVNRETEKMLYGQAFNDKGKQCGNFAVHNGDIDEIRKIVDRKYGTVYKVQIEENENEDVYIKAKNIIYNYLLEIAENFIKYEREN